MRLSILVCSLAERRQSLDRLMRRLTPQHNRHPDDVEILVEADDGQMTVGRKRNQLARRARGQYHAFVDDDDDVSDDYVTHILAATASQPDVVGITGNVIAAGHPYMRSLRQSITHKTWHTTAHAMTRTPNHLNPVRASLALMVGFADCNAAEDRDYAARLRPLLKTEVMIEHDRPLYTYNYEAAASMTNDRPSGYIYRNTFGTDFTLELQLRPQDARFTSFQDVQTTTRSAITLAVGNTAAASRVPSVSDGVLRVQRKDGEVLATLNGSPPFHLDLDLQNTTLPVRVSVAGRSVTADWPPAKCVVGGRELRYP